MFSGKLMAVIAATLEPGDIEVKVTSKGMEPAVIKFESLPAATEAVAGVTARMANTDMPIVMGSADEIPVRKIEIISESGQKLDPTKREIIVRAKVGIRRMPATKTWNGAWSTTQASSPISRR